MHLSVIYIDRAIGGLYFLGKFLLGSSEPHVSPFESKFRAYVFTQLENLSLLTHLSLEDQQFSGPLPAVRVRVRSHVIRPAYVCE